MNHNPYKILGVSPNADDETIKKAYRELARKYHPDRYSDSDLADLASEKMKEVNAAYEEICRMRSAGGDTMGGDPRGSGYRTDFDPDANSSAHHYSEEARSKFTLIRNCINSRNITEAERLLSEVDQADRGAEWVFLMGCVQLHKGQYVDAQRSFETACRMDPSNHEYWTFKQRMHAEAKKFGSGYDTGRREGGCDLCTTLICADCCCELCGGDLISCC